jgi:GT2 family glycosyltransferase
LKKLVFPRVSRPDVTIVMVTLGAPNWVRRSLRAMIDRTEPCYEMVIVDNASPRGMAVSLSQEIENARLISNPVNRGFGPANNQGANVARGSLLVFLNSDALVHARWLSYLREAIERHPTAGAVAPRLLNVDGTLQEAGALLFQNGYTQFYGFGEDAERAPYCFPREIDYASAACLLVRRQAFVEVGGFDAIYAPAYYEDVDLCLSLREKGYRILYEPRAVATHARGASSSPTLAVRLWRRNHPLFFERWGERLRSQPAYTPPDGNPRVKIAARDAPAPARILVAAEDGPGARDVTEELARLCPGSARAIIFGAAPDREVIDRLAAAGWEIADAPAIAKRLFHYDAVVFQGRKARTLFGSVVDEAQPQAARLSSDVPDLPGALAAAGIPPRDLAEGPPA